jgi:toxin ParE1/3/4
MVEIVWFEMAEADLINIHQYIAHDDKKRARNAIKKIVASAQQLACFPHLGKIGRVNNTREFLVAKSPFIIVYRFLEEKSEVQILTILHSARMYP